MRDYYKEIDEVVSSYEQYKPYVMKYKIELNPAEYIGLLDRLNKLNEERPEKFLKDDLIPKIQNAIASMDKLN
jgi:hypothetical protein